MKLGVPLKGHTLFPKQKHLLPASPPISRPNTNLTPTSCSTGLLITSFKGGTCFHQLLLFSINCNCFLFNHSWKGEKTKSAPSTPTDECRARPMSSSKSRT